MWLSKGRSGIGDKNINVTYEDWNGLSPNGRQFKNPLTDEVRNLSGADYWHARKSMNLHQWEGQNLFLPNGMANIAIFTDDYVWPVKTQKADTSGFDIVFKMSHRDKQGLHECFFLMEDGDMYVLHTLNGVAKYKKREFSKGYVVHPGEEFIDLLDQLEIVTYKMYKEGMITQAQWLEEKEDIQAMRNKEYDRYEKELLKKK